MAPMRSPQLSDTQKRFLLHQQFLQEIQIRFADLANPQSWLNQLIYQLLVEELRQQLAEPLVSSAFRSFVQGILRGRGLEVRETEAVISEVFLRAMRQLQSGCVVQNPATWLRGIALNVVREMTRKRQHLTRWEGREFCDESLDAGGGASGYDCCEYPRFSQPLGIIWQQLSPIDHRMLVLRVLESYPWQQVQTILQQEFGETIAVTTLRKRYQRLLEKLRKLLQALEGDVA
ncbi:MAG: hypothetical protein VKJ24_04480 [Synechococcales bacterium]|nr:hypothetical protein [Synechococcales bacterium]